VTKSDDPTAPPSGDGRGGEMRAMLLGLLLLADFLVIVVMLVTDKNLQTDFGAASPYYVHWYGVLAMGIVDLLAAFAVFGNFSSYGMRTMSQVNRKRVSIAALGWSVLAILALLGILATYQQVGFSSIGDFAHYLFGVTAYPGVSSYIPWLYDLLLVLYLLTAAVAVLVVVRARCQDEGPQTTST
jgi:hypothetical protein